MSDERGSQQTRNKHLSLSDRQEIQACLCSAATFKAIAHRIGKDPTTVSKEVKKHIIVTAAAPLRANAGKKPVPCLRLLKAPFVCNGCMKKRSCRLEKHEYSASAAYAEYRDRLVECRSGIALNKQSFYDGDRIISDCIRKGQHMYHIMQSQIPASPSPAPTGISIKDICRSAKWISPEPLSSSPAVREKNSMSLKHLKSTEPMNASVISSQPTGSPPGLKWIRL